MVDYNAIIPHELEELYRDEALSEESIFKIMMICDLLMIKDSSVFLKKERRGLVLRLLSAKEDRNP